MPDPVKPPYLLTATEASALLRSGALGVEELAMACLDRATSRDSQLKAWAYLSRDRVLSAARALDKSKTRGPLHGLPIGIKDMIDTRDMPTEYNSAIYRGHRPAKDAACVDTLRAAGALIFGKTETTEFAAAGRNAPTGNPWNLDHTSGGSSSGSAAAVADFHVPLALGTQTGGSTIRPASFCGVFAMKPSWGAVSREGLKVYSITLDTLGWFGRSVADLALLCDVFGIEDDEPPGEIDISRLRIAVCRSPGWPAAEPATEQAMIAAETALAAAGIAPVTLDLPEPFAELIDLHKVIMHSEGRAAFFNLHRSAFDQLHDDFRQQVENRTGISRKRLLYAYDLAAECRTAFDRIAAGFDAVLTPSAPGEAPLGRIPGNPIFNLMWTLLHVPCVNVPGFVGPLGLPVGVTLTGPRFTDRRLLAVAEAVAGVLPMECLSSQRSA